jgi:hypothetical protein
MYIEKVKSKKTLETTIFLLTFKVTDEKVGSGARSESGFGTGLYGSAEPDPYQNVTDPQHFKVPTPLL